MESKSNLNQLFDLARSSSSTISADEAIARFELDVQALPNPSSKKKFLTKNGWIMISTIAIVSTAIIGFLLNSNEVVDLAKIEVNSTELKTKTQEESELLNEREFKKQPETTIVEISSLDFLDLEFFEHENLKMTLISQPVRKLISKHPEPEEPKYYPKLTPDEIKANEKQKKKMLKALDKLDKKSYVYIPSGSMKIEEDVFSVQAFHMSVNEVTNLEYRTFMFDLIINDRKAEFDLARPQQDLWTSVADSTGSLEKNYFSHPAFDEYPVVNVTQKGAELYCKWLTTELEKAYGGNHNDVRLPVKEEWIVAASAHGTHQHYPWDGTSIKNEAGCFMANANSNIDGPNKSEFILGEDGAAYTAKTGSYNPNEYGLYCMSGNVAELVYDTELSKDGLYSVKKNLLQVGGGWMDPAEDLLITPSKQIDFTGASPNVGFRVVRMYVSPRLK